MPSGPCWLDFKTNPRRRPNWITTTSRRSTTDGQPYYAMKYVEGESLAEMLEGGPLTNERAARYAREIALALEAAHAAGVLHRDLKPHNVMVDSRRDRALLTDFGLPRLRHSVATTSSPKSWHSDIDRATVVRKRGCRCRSRTPGIILTAMASAME